MDRHAGHRVDGAAGEALIPPGQFCPNRALRCALVDLEDGVVPVGRAHARRDFVRIRGKGIVLLLPDGQVVRHLAARVDCHPEGQFAAGSLHVGLDVLEICPIIRPIQGDGDGGGAGLIGPLLHLHLHVGDGAAPLGAGNGNARNGLAVDLRPVVPEVAHGNGDGQPGEVRRQRPVPQDQPAAHGVHVQVLGRILLTVDGDEGVVLHLHQLVKGQGDGDHLPGVVGPRRGGDAHLHWGFEVIVQGHGAVADAVLHPVVQARALLPAGRTGSSVRIRDSDVGKHGVFPCRAPGGVLKRKGAPIGNRNVCAVKERVYRHSVPLRTELGILALRAE